MLKKLMVIVAAVSLSLTGCKGKQETQQQAPTPMVVYEEASIEDVISTDNYVGRLEAVSQAAITARVSGFLEAIHVKEGDMVKKGQPLFTIEKTQYNAALREAQASLVQAQANANNTRLARERGQALADSGSIARARLDDLVANDDVAKANVTAAQAAVDNARTNLSYTDIASPIDGKVGLIVPYVGETVSASSGTLTTIVADDPMYVLFTVTDRQLQDLRNKYRNGDPEVALNRHAELEITLSNNTVYSHKGTINFIDNSVSGVTDSVVIRGEFPNPHGDLIQGQSVNVKLLAKEPVKSIVISQVALINDIGGKYVMVVNPDNVIERRLVTLGMVLPGGKQEIVDGLQSGDRIVVEGIQRVQPGVTVQPFTKAQYEEVLQQQQAAMQQGAQGGGH